MSDARKVTRAWRWVLTRHEHALSLVGPLRIPT
ncbi:uncharacterized protein G2W53_012011 [Senna tora]|uniref:Uncharacterized protein n=1 Tax=Senna tora TaxID=362788 RepID=A0A834TW53_9FABA|nr:uncharacterized protein G2W53_012011 [Senna tora]